MHTATALTGPNSSHTSVRLTRPELESLLAGPLAGLVDTLVDVLQRNRVAPRSSPRSRQSVVGHGYRLSRKAFRRRCGCRWSPAPMRRSPRRPVRT